MSKISIEMVLFPGFQLLDCPVGKRLLCGNPLGLLRTLLHRAHEYDQSKGVVSPAELFITSDQGKFGGIYQTIDADKKIDRHHPALSNA